MLYLAACKDKIAFFTFADHRGYKLLSCQNVHVAISYLLYNTNIRFGNKLYRHMFGDSIGTDCENFMSMETFT